MAKNIVICSDGTGQDGLRPTNVSRLFAVLDLGDPASQIACYDAGVGTVPHPELAAAVARRDPGVVEIPAAEPSAGPVRHVRRLAGLAVGYGLFQNVKELYEVLVDHYAEGDRLFLFGFSRGAFTVRVLAGLLFRCGVLRPEHRHRYARAFELYEPHLEALAPAAAAKLMADVEEFRRAYARTCGEIAFLGIWDTVKSVGYLRPRSLPHTRRNPIVRTVRHALSIGEARSFFVPTTWGGLDADSEPPIAGQDVQEIWFAGNHTDVGGGYDEGESGLAAISLRWMVDEAAARGLRVDGARYDELLARAQRPPRVAHDELGRWGWRVSERLPRWELENDPPPPRRLFRWGPTGRRSMAGSARGGKVLVDSHAAEIYDAPSPPWSGVETSGGRGATVTFVDTARGTFAARHLASSR